MDHRFVGLGESGVDTTQQDSVPTQRPADASRLVRPPPLELAIAAVLVLASIGFLLFAVNHDDPSPAQVRSSGAEAAPPLVSPPPSPTAATPTEAPLDVLLPPSLCSTDGAGTVSCTDPAPGIESVLIRTYPTRKDMYSAYVRDVEEVSGESFVDNVGDCSGKQHEGELSWSLSRTKSRDFPLQLVRDDLVDPATDVAGRVFCATMDGEHTIVWTQHPYRLATVVGDSADLVGKWWVDAHVYLACAEGVEGTEGCS